MSEEPEHPGRAQSDEEIDRELALARARCEPARVQALARGPLDAAQCRRVGAALAELADAHAAAHEDDEDLDEDALADEVRAMQRQAAALLVEGGAPWRLVIDGDTALTPDGPRWAYLERTLSCLEGWETDGAELLEPVEATLPWPRATARAIAVRLAEQAVQDASAHDGMPELLAGVAAALRDARALADPDDAAALAGLRRRMGRAYRTLAADERAAIAAAEEAEDDQDANRRAYMLQTTVLLLGIADAALADAPDFRRLFGGNPHFWSGLVGLVYPMYAIGDCLERYYSLGAAGFDELFTPESDLKAEVAIEAIRELLRAALQAARRELAP